MEGPLVSIGIPTYNRLEGLKKVLDCIVCQTYKNIEVIVSDNASPGNAIGDFVLEYCKKDSRIKFTRQNVNIGAIANFIFVMDQAQGKYFMWAADDDEFSPITIEQSVYGFLQNDAVVLSSLNCNIIDLSKGTVIQPLIIPHTVSYENKIKFRKVIDYMFNEINVYFYSLIKLDALKKCNSYKAKIFGADVFLLLELLEYGDININTSQVGLTSYMHSSQASASMDSYIKIKNTELNIWHRNLFFSNYLFTYLKFISKTKKLKINEKIPLFFYVIREWITTKKFHLVKYDLRLHKPVQWTKKWIKKMFI